LVRLPRPLSRPYINRHKRVLRKRGWPRFPDRVIDGLNLICGWGYPLRPTGPRLIAAWLSGYYNAKRNNRMIDLQTFEENMSKVSNYCSDEKNFKVPVMKAVEQVLGK
jgi:HdeA/HdeB family